MFLFRKSTLEDIDTMVSIANDGKALLKSRGIQQWQRGTYPDRNLFIQDVADGIGYVVAEGSEVVAICAVTFTDEESYRHLHEGAWETSDDALYATVHRAAVARAHQGRQIPVFLFDSVAKLAEKQGAQSIRADTHPDNIAMQRSLEKAHFRLCGNFDILDGDEAGDLRLAYERLL